MAVSDEQKKSDINEAQTFLHVISKYNPKIPSVVPDGIYGKETADAVKAFQKEYGLPETAKIDKETWDKLYEVYTKAAEYFDGIETIAPFVGRDTVMTKGDAGCAVYVVQAMINTVAQFYDNMNNIELSGTYDKATEESIKEIQKVNGIVPDGNIDKKTWNSLAKLYNYHAAIDQSGTAEKKQSSADEGAVQTSVKSVG